MAYLIIGFLLGVAVSWFWQTQFSGVPAFQQLMQKELAVNGQLGSVTVLKKRLELMEKKLLEMEKSSEGATLEPERPAAVPPVAGEETAVKPEAEALKVVKNKKGSVNKTELSERRKSREKVLTMWKAGEPVNEIAAQTQLGKGEIELVINLKENNMKGKTGNGSV